MTARGGNRRSFDMGTLRWRRVRLTTSLERLYYRDARCELSVADKGRTSTKHLFDGFHRSIRSAYGVYAAYFQQNNPDSRIC